MPSSRKEAGGLGFKVISYTAGLRQRLHFQSTNTLVLEYKLQHYNKLLWFLRGGIPKNYVYICLLWGRYELWDTAIWGSSLLENSTGHWNLAFVPCQTLWEQDDVMWVCRGLTNGTADENLMLVISIFGELTLSRVLFCKTKTKQMFLLLPGLCV